MANRTTEEFDEKVKYVTDVFCSKCGESCKTSGQYHGLIDTKVYGGYSSPKLEDGTTYIFSLCEICLDKLFQSFKLPPEKYEDVEWGQDSSPKFKYK